MVYDLIRGIVVFCQAVYPTIRDFAVIYLLWEIAERL